MQKLIQPAGVFMQPSTWTGVAVAVGVVIAIGALFAVILAELGDTGTSAAGWGAMVLGVVATTALGVGLMALVFFSNRRGYDDLGTPER